MEEKPYKDWHIRISWASWKAFRKYCRRHKIPLSYKVQELMEAFVRNPDILYRQHTKNSTKKEEIRTNPDEEFDFEG